MSNDLDKKYEELLERASVLSGEIAHYQRKHNDLFNMQISGSERRTVYKSQVLPLLFEMLVNDNVEAVTELNKVNAHISSIEAFKVNAPQLLQMIAQKQEDAQRKLEQIKPQLTQTENSVINRDNAFKREAKKIQNSQVTSLPTVVSRIPWNMFNDRQYADLEALIKDKKVEFKNQL